ncbi:MAG: hypothetical protein Kow00129_12280 [Thermoleophilia bacterium]
MGQKQRGQLRIRVYDAGGRAVRIKLRYLVLLALGIAAVAGAFLFLPVYITQTPSFCSNCHIMDPFIDSWERSTHSKFGCVECHVKPGVVNHFVNQIRVTENIYENFFGTADMPATISSASNENCLQDGCHSLNRTASTSGDLKIPHREHVQLRDLECKHCHFNVVHTVDGGTPVPPMGVCAMCHDGTQAPNTCDTCHERPPSAEGVHPEEMAVEEHAEIARGRVRDCFDCHHSDQSFCAQEGCHAVGEFEGFLDSERLRERFGL